MNQPRNASLFDSFRKHICPTSDMPLGLSPAKAQGCTITLADGTEVLDFLSGHGVSNIGHGVQSVIDAVTEQLGHYMHVMVYGEFVQTPQVLLAQALSNVLPEPLSMTYFTSTGAEAVEGAMKLVRKATGRTRFICFEDAYHGDTMGALSLGGDKEHRKPFEPLIPDVVRIPFNDFEALRAIGPDVAGVFVEPIQAEAGVRLPAPGYLSAMREACDQAGALLVFDEIQVGFGRTGDWFACQGEDVTPDLLLMAKALGGGMPLGGFAGAPPLMQHLAGNPALSHLTTFGGHPVSCAAGLAALRYMHEEGLVQLARSRGALLMEQLQHAVIDTGLARSAWGRGLIVGVDVGSPHRGRAVVKHLLEQGILIGDALHAPGVLKLEPPLVISESEIERAVLALATALRAV